MTRATPEGTAQFARRHADAVVADHFRRFGALTLSSVGLGTYLGPADDAADARYVAAIHRALQLGVNVLDTAVNYRHERSERAVGRALASSGVAREEVLVATKGGFLVGGAGVASPREVVAGCHCIAPAYLATQIERSRRNLGLATVDVYYLHNPEMQRQEVSATTFEARLRAAFEVLERARDDGAIGCYGAATWSGFRVDEGAGHLDLDAIVALAREVGGDDHGFRVVQLPVNRGMPEAVARPTQRGRTLVAAAREHGLYVMSSASIGQGKLSAHDAIAWLRQQPGLGTALVGMGRLEHVSENAGAFRRSS